MEKRKLTNEQLLYARINTPIELFKMGMMRDPGSFQPDNIVGKKLNLGAGKKHIHDVHSLDYPDWDAEHDYIPWPDESIELIHAYHFLEHLADPRHCLQECQRVLVDGGCMNIAVPLWCSQISCMDIDHKSFYSEKTFYTMFDDSDSQYEKDKQGWEFVITFQLIMGIESHNLALFTQLQKQKGTK